MHAVSGVVGLSEGHSSLRHWYKGEGVFAEWVGVKAEKAAGPLPVSPCAGPGQRVGLAALTLFRREGHLRSVSG